MAFTTYFICIALFCSVRGNPLGQGSFLDYAFPMSNLGSTTVCETSPNLLGLGLGYPYPLNHYGYMPYSYPRPLSPLSCPFADNLGYYPYSNLQVPTTTVCETSPNIVSLLPLPNVPVPNVGSTTICETTPNVLGFLPYPNVPNVGSTTVCETAPNILPMNPYLNSLSLPYGSYSGYGSFGMPFL